MTKRGLTYNYLNRYLLAVLAFAITSGISFAPPNNSTYYLRLIADQEIGARNDITGKVLEVPLMSPDDQEHLLAALTAKFGLVESTNGSAHTSEQIGSAWVQYVSQGQQAVSELRTGFSRRVARARWITGTTIRTGEEPDAIKLFENMDGPLPNKIQLLGRLLRDKTKLPTQRYDAAVLLAALLHKGQGTRQKSKAELTKRLREGDELAKQFSVRGLGEVNINQHPQTITEIGKGLQGDESVRVRMEAAMASLVGNNPRITAVLTHAIANDPAPLVRQEAAWALGELDRLEAIPALKKAFLSDSSDDVKIAAGQAIGKMASGDTERYYRNPQYPDPKLASNAVQKALQEALYDGPPIARMIAALALRNIDASDDMKHSYAVRLLPGEEHQGVRWALLRLLNNHGEHSSYPDPTLVEVVQDDLKRDRNLYLRAEAATILETWTARLATTFTVPEYGDSLHRLRILLNKIVPLESDPFVSAILNRVQSNANRISITNLDAAIPAMLISDPFGVRPQNRIGEVHLGGHSQPTNSFLPHAMRTRLRPPSPTATEALRVDSHADRLLPALVVEAALTEGSPTATAIAQTPSFNNGGGAM